jgi:hypothetical protein
MQVALLILKIEASLILEITKIRNKRKEKNHGK